MTSTPTITITCDWCNKTINKNEQYYRIDTMIRGKATLHRDRQLKHCCEKCTPQNIKDYYNRIEVKNMDIVRYRK